MLVNYYQLSLFNVYKEIYSKNKRSLVMCEITYPKKFKKKCFNSFISKNKQLDCTKFINHN